MCLYDASIPIKYSICEKFTISKVEGQNLNKILYQKNNKGKSIYPNNVFKY
jgi:hypothetical protein